MNVIYEHLKNKFSKKLFTNALISDTIKLAKSEICGNVIDYEMVEPILSQYGLLDETQYARVLPSNGNKEFANYARWGYNIPEDALNVDFKKEKIDDVFNKWIFFAIESYEFKEIKTSRSKSIVIVRSIDQKQNIGPIEGSFEVNEKAISSIPKHKLNICGYDITVTEHTSWNAFIKYISVLGKFALGG